MMATRHFDLPVLLSPEHASCDECLTRFESLLRETGGVEDVRIDRQQGVAILHYDADRVPLATIENLARREGLRLGERYVHRVIPIEGMDCTNCAQTLERGVARLEGVETVSVNFAGARMAVEFAADQTDLKAISRRVADLGYRVGEESDDGSIAAPERTSFLARRENLQTFIAAILTLIGGGLDLAGVADSLPMLFYVAAILVAGIPLARRAVAVARATHQLDINMLMTIAVIGAVFIGEWLEAAAVVVLFSLGEALEGYTMDRARRSIRSLMNLAPTEAIVRRGGAEQKIRVAEIAPGDVIVVRPGERMPVDGVVVSGASTVNQAPVTGESVPVEKDLGSEIFAGTINGAGVLDVRATRPASDSTIARIIRMVEDAQAQKAPSQRFIDAFAKYYTPAVVVLAALIAVAPPLVVGDWSGWLYRALVLLVIACPCALVISTPVSIVSAISSAARNGVLIKGGAYLEAAGGLRALAFDKTGTLTAGEPRVTAVIPRDGLSEDDLLRRAALVEQYSEHPLGEAIVRAATERGVGPNGARPAAVQAHSGRGIEARVDGTRVRIGTRAYVLDGAVDADLERELSALERSGQTAVLVAIGDGVAGIIGLADQLRPEASAALAAVKDAGIEQTVMLTGDRREVAEAIATTVGVDAVDAELLPGQKVDAVERLLERHGRVGMVGDGVNDAPALARATVGIAMGAAGTDTALETADIALMGDDLSKVAFTMRLSRTAKRVIAQNIGLSLAVKAVFLVLAVGGTATLWEAIAADVGAALLVTLNGMRLLRYRP